MNSWAATELATVDLGDPRRGKRLIDVVETLARAPMASVPEACDGDWAAIKGTYRFWDNPAVTPDAIRAAHRDATVTRLADHALILAIQDTTEINLTTHPATTGLGHLAGQGQRGMLAHSVLAVSPEGVPLGLLSQHIWARDLEEIGSRHQRRARPTAEKESARWLEAQAATLAAVPPEIGVLTIADAEADIYDLLAAPRREDATS